MDLSSGTNNIMHGSYITAASHISYVLRWSGTCAKECGSMRTASLRISCVLRWSGTTFTLLAMSIYIFRPGEVQIFFMDRRNDSLISYLITLTSKWSYKKLIQKWWNYILNWPFIDVKSMNIQQKTWFLLKNWWKHTLNRWFYQYKTYENILKFNF